MADPRGFLKLGRAKAKERPPEERVRHFREFVEEPSAADLAAQASRMCHVSLAGVTHAPASQTLPCAHATGSLQIVQVVCGSSLHVDTPPLLHCLAPLGVSPQGKAGSFGPTSARESAPAAMRLRKAALSPAAYSMIADEVPAKRRSTALGIYSSGIYIGSGLATYLGGRLVRGTSSDQGIDLPLIGVEQLPYGLDNLRIPSGGLLQYGLLPLGGRFHHGVKDLFNLLPVVPLHKKVATNPAFTHLR